jgi:ubiquitin-conjugating enzyme E2 M
MRALRKKSLSNKNLLVKKVKDGTKMESHILRITKEWNEWNDIPGVTIEFPQGINKLNIFDITLTPSTGYWKGGRFKFHFQIPSDYPISAPDVTCQSKPIYHPNIDVRGNICLNILRPDWTAAGTFENVIYGLILLFENPNFTDPLPSGVFKESMEPHILKAYDEKEFINIVNMTMKGGKVEKLGDTVFSCVL